MKYLLIALVAVPVVYVVGALVLVSFAPHAGKSGSNLDFDRLALDAKPAPLKRFAARDGATLSIARYPADTHRKLILLHGSGSQGRYLATAARYFADRGIADVYVPNMRGHYRSGPVRGDIDHVGRLEQDIADEIASIRNEEPDAFVVVGGHSSGGAVAIRFAHSPFARAADGYLLIAPFLSYNAPTYIQDAGGWAHVSVPRIIGLTMFDRIGFHAMDHFPAVVFDMPKRLRDGTETLTYSFTLMSNINLNRDYEADIAALPARTLVMVGKNDRAMKADAFPPLFHRLTKAEVDLFDGVGHLDAVSDPAMLETAAVWLEGLPEKR